MNNPTTVILKDGLVPLREICEMFKAKYIWYEGKKYKLSESWRKENNQ